MKNYYHKMFRNVLRFIGGHHWLYKIIAPTTWYHYHVYDEAQRLMGNR